MPRVYDLCLGGAVFAPYGADLARRAAFLTPQRVLELAAGTGIVTIALVSALPSAEIVATDLNASMVDYAAAKVQGPRWEVADAQDLRFADGSFDLVVCQFGLMFLSDRVNAYRGVGRVLQPGGSLLVNAWDTLDSMWSRRPLSTPWPSCSRRTRLTSCAASRTGTPTRTGSETTSRQPGSRS
jgi:ubiquinone/menaquinone biosynthesis C-methylase UbiE